jgi:hypothetical protein
MDFAAFFSTYFSDWVGWMSGPFSILLTVWGFLRPKASSVRPWLFAAAAVTFLIGPIHIWTIEHRGRLAAEDASTPKLAVDVTGAGIGDLDGKLAVSVQMRVVNRGAPSIAMLNEVLMQSSDGRQFLGEPVMPADNGEDLKTTSGQTVHLGFPESIGQVFGSTPIPRGGAQRGWGTFILNGATRQEIWNPNTQITVKFVDVDGKVVFVNRALGNIGEPVYLPTTPPQP